MHEPDQRAAFARRAQVTAADGVLLLQYHSIVTIVAHGPVERVAARALRLLLADHADATARRCRNAGRRRMGVRSLRRNGVARRRARRGCARRVRAAHPRDRERRWASPNSADCRQTSAQRRRTRSSRCEDWLEEEASAGRQVFAYGAASRAVALFSRAGYRFPIAYGGRRRLARQTRQADAGDRHSASCHRRNSSRRSRTGCCLTLPDLLPEVSAQFSRARRAGGRSTATIPCRCRRRKAEIGMTTVLFNPDINDDERRTRAVQRPGPGLCGVNRVARAHRARPRAHRRRVRLDGSADGAVRHAGRGFRELSGRPEAEVHPPPGVEATDQVVPRVLWLRSRPTYFDVPADAHFDVRRLSDVGNLLCVSSAS